MPHNFPGKKNFKTASGYRRVHLKGSEQQKDSCVSSELLHISQDSAASLFFGHA
jgi:hypothetical protein